MSITKLPALHWVSGLGAFENSIHCQQSFFRNAFQVRRQKKTQVPCTHGICRFCKWGAPISLVIHEAETHVQKCRPDSIVFENSNPMHLYPHYLKKEDKDSTFFCCASVSGSAVFSSGDTISGGSSSAGSDACPSDVGSAACSDDLASQSEIQAK